MSHGRAKELEILLQKNLMKRGEEMLWEKDGIGLCVEE